jgi:uncharacterized Zn-finger protein
MISCQAFAVLQLLLNLLCHIIFPQKLGTFCMTREEQIVQKFPHRCPYCDQIVSYDQLNLKAGENEVRCLFCQKTYVVIIADDHGEE